MKFKKGHIPWHKGKDSRIDRECFICKKIMLVQPKDKRKYCSRKCFGISHKNSVVVLCIRCKSPRTIAASLLRKQRGKYCSVGCARKDHPPTWMHQNYEGRGKKIGDSLRGKYIGEKNCNWKGDGVGYRGLHKWVEKHLGKANHCEVDKLHKSTRYHWANKSREYKRDLTDWIQLYPKCHAGFDRKGLVISY